MGRAKAEYQIDKNQIDTMELTISITMQVRFWREIYTILTKEKGPIPFELRHPIGEALSTIDETSKKTFKIES